MLLHSLGHPVEDLLKRVYEICESSFSSTMDAIEPRLP